MTRTTKQSDDRPYQDYEIGNGATVRIFYDANGARPFMLHDDDVALISFDRGKFDAAKRAILTASDEYAPSSSPRNVTQIPTRSRDMSPAAKAAAMARLGEVAEEPAEARPMTSRDAFQAEGAPLALLEAIERAAQEG